MSGYEDAERHCALCGLRWRGSPTAMQHASECPADEHPTPANTPTGVHVVAAQVHNGPPEWAEINRKALAAFLSMVDDLEALATCKHPEDPDDYNRCDHCGAVLDGAGRWQRPKLVDKVVALWSGQ